MSYDKLEKIINESFEKKEKVGPKSDKKLIKAINETINLVDSGKIRVANKQNGNWIVNQWIKKAILLSFRINKMEMMKGPYTLLGMTKCLERRSSGKKKIGKKQDTVMFLTELSEKEHILQKMWF